MSSFGNAIGARPGGSEGASSFDPFVAQSLGFELPDLSVSGDRSVSIARGRWVCDFFINSRASGVKFHPHVVYEIGRFLRGRCPVGTATPEHVRISFAIEDGSASTAEMIQGFADATASRLDVGSVAISIFNIDDAIAQDRPALRLVKPETDES